MSITVVPNFWSQMLNNFDDGVRMGQQNYWQQKEREDRLALQRQQQAMQGLEMLRNLQSAGDVSADTVNKYIASNTAAMPWMQGINVQQSLGELRRDVMNNPVVQTPGVAIPGMGIVPGVKQKHNDQTYEALNLTPPSQRQRANRLSDAQIRGAEANATRSEFDAQGSMLNLEAFNRMNTAFKGIAEAAADRAIVAAGGIEKLTAKQVDSIAKAGVADLEKIGILQQFGAISEQQREVLQREIASRILDRYMQGQELGIARLNASRVGSTPDWDRAADNIMRDLTVTNNEIDALNKKFATIAGMTTLMTDDQIALSFKSNPQMLKSVQDYRTQLNALESRRDDLRKAHMNLTGSRYSRTEVPPRMGMDNLPAMPNTQQQNQVVPPVAGGRPGAAPSAPMSDEEKEYNAGANMLRQLPRNQRAAEIARFAAIPGISPAVIARLKRDFGVD